MAQVTNVLMEKKHVFVGSVCFNKTKTGGLLNKPSWLVETTNQKKQILQFFTSVVETTHQQVGFFAYKSGTNEKRSKLPATRGLAIQSHPAVFRDAMSIDLFSELNRHHPALLVSQQHGD